MKTHRFGLVYAVIFSWMTVVSLQAGTEMSTTASSPSDSKTMVSSPKDSKSYSTAPADASLKDWAVELGTGAIFSNVRDSALDSYSIIPVDLTAVYKIDDVSLDHFWNGWLRGNTEFLFQGYYDPIVSNDREHYILGMNFGPRYNFVRPGWKFVPYVEGLVGFGFADSNPTPPPDDHGLGQDFNFTFGVGAGVKYDITTDWYASLGIQYTHFSNAGLSEPAYQNRAIDALGPKVAIGYRF